MRKTKKPRKRRGDTAVGPLLPIPEREISHGTLPFMFFDLQNLEISLQLLRLCPELELTLPA